MSDPRGRGFNRVNRKWYAQPVQQARLNSPTAQGWTQCGTGEDGQPVYRFKNAVAYYSDGSRQERGWWVLVDDARCYCFDRETLFEVTGWIERGCAGVDLVEPREVQREP